MDLQPVEKGMQALFQQEGDSAHDECFLVTCTTFTGLQDAVVEVVSQQEEVPVPSGDLHSSR